MIAELAMTKRQINVILTTDATHSANFDEKVHKPQSKSYSRIGANMQLIFTHLMKLNTSISASQLFGV